MKQWAPSHDRAGSYETCDWGRKWRPVEFARPAGRFNLVAQCDECGKFAWDCNTESGLFGCSKFPEPLSDGPANWNW